MIMHSCVLTATTNKHLHILTPERYAVPVSGHLCSSALCRNAVPVIHAYHFISKLAHRLNLQSRATDTHSSTHPSALKEGVNYLLCIRHSTVLQVTMYRNIILTNQILILLKKLLIWAFPSLTFNSSFLNSWHWKKDILIRIFLWLMLCYS